MAITKIKTALLGIVFTTLVMSSPLFSNQAWALSCAAPSLDQAAIDEALIIFEGTAGESRALATQEQAAARDAGIASFRVEPDGLKVTSFMVTRGWKGVAGGQNIAVLYDAAWGDLFNAGQDYLIVSPQKLAHLVYSPPCAITASIGYAEELGLLQDLEKTIGNGHHLKIKTEDRACSNDDDCGVVQTHCGSCSCGTGVKASLVESYRQQFEALCATVRLSESCEISCPPPEASCQAGRCLAR